MTALDMETDPRIPLGKGIDMGQHMEIQGRFSGTDIQVAVFQAFESG